LVRLVLVLLIACIFAFAKEQKIIFSYSTPPYVFEDGSGIVITIVKEALAYKGHTVKPILVNIGRGLEIFKEGNADASSIIQQSSGVKAFYSADYMQYHNAAFTLKKNHCKIQKMGDLANYRIMAFQHASKYLNGEFAKTIKKAGQKYTEVADQKQQVYMLFKGRGDIAVMDRHIFRFYRNQLISEKKINPNEEFEMFELFSPTKYQTAFKEEKMRDDFNEGINYLKATGRYDKIYKEYSDKYFDVAK